MLYYLSKFDLNSIFLFHESLSNRESQMLLGNLVQQQKLQKKYTLCYQIITFFDLSSYAFLRG